MLSKEEIEKAKAIMRKLLFDENGKVIPYIDFSSDDYDDWNGYTMKQYAESLETLLQYIAELETREQKLIDKLEEDIAKNKELYKNTSEDIKLYRVAKINYAQEILSIVKGEKHG